jgi:hypothetical protein
MPLTPQSRIYEQKLERSRKKYESRNAFATERSKKAKEEAFSTPPPKIHGGHPGLNYAPGAGTDIISQLSERAIRNYTTDVGDATSRTIKDTLFGGEGKSNLLDYSLVNPNTGNGILDSFIKYNPTNLLAGNLVNNSDFSQMLAPGDIIPVEKGVSLGLKAVNNPLVKAAVKGGLNGGLTPKNQLVRNLHMGIDPNDVVDVFGNIIRGAREATAKERLIQSITEGIPESIPAVVEKNITGKNRLPSIQPSLGSRVWTPSGHGLDNALSIIDAEGQPKNASEAMNMILAHTYGADSGTPIDQNIGQRLQNYYETLKQGADLPNFEYGVIDPKASTDRVKDTMFSYSRLFDMPKVVAEHPELSEMFKAGSAAGDFNLGRYVSDAAETVYKTGTNAGSKKPGVFLSEISDPAYNVAREVMGGVDPALRISGGWTLPIDHNPMGIGLLRDSSHSLAYKIGAEEAYRQTKLVAERMGHSGIAIPEALNYRLGTTLRHTAESPAWRDVPKHLAKVWQEHGLLDSYGSNWKWIKENAPDLAKEMEDLMMDPNFVKQIDEKSF